MDYPDEDVEWQDKDVELQDKDVSWEDNNVECQDAGLEPQETPSPAIILDEHCFEDIYMVDTSSPEMYHTQAEFDPSVHSDKKVSDPTSGMTGASESGPPLIRKKVPISEYDQCPHLTLDQESSRELSYVTEEWGFTKSRTVFEYDKETLAECYGGDLDRMWKDALSGQAPPASVRNTKVVFL